MLREPEDREVGISFPGGHAGSAAIYRLLEIGDSKLAEAIGSGQDLYIRGHSEEDEAVLCTGDATFRLRELLTSNMFLVVENAASDEAMIVGTPNATLEAALVARPPGIDQLAAALQKAPYNAEDEESFPDSRLHVDLICSSFQASNVEIEKCLKSLDALVIGSHYRILGPQLQCRFFDLFFNTAIIEDWKLESTEGVELARLVEAMSSQHSEEFPEHITRHILRCYSHSEDDVLHRFDSVKVARFYAIQLFKAKAVWNVDDFIKAWVQSLHEFWTPELSSISDLFLREEHVGSGRTEIHRFFRMDLPTEAEARFIALFKTKPRWEYDELIPFIQDLGKDCKEIDAVVLKHGRISSAKSIKMITPRSQLLD